MESTESRPGASLATRATRPGLALVLALLSVPGSLLVVPFAAPAASGSGGPQATASASVKKTIKKLVKKEVAKQLADKTGPAGPQGEQGAQGPAGAAPACQGNDASDKMVQAGSVCIDRYEASIWTAPTGGTQITGAIPAPCTANGQNCTNIYARSVAGVTPRANITWFQAQQALANSGKRLPSNAEWQQAAAGTPDSASCRVSGGSAVATGSMASCVSNWGGNDMVGNLGEWVADWDEEAAACANLSPSGFGTDITCIGRADTEAPSHVPGALIRGGSIGFGSGTNAGPFAVDGTEPPSYVNFDTGFRGVRY